MKIPDYSYLNRLERNQIDGQLPLHVHMHLTVPWVWTQWVWVPLWPMMLPATGP